MNTATQTNDLPTMLRQARHARRISKLELPLRMGVSQRHVSFVEGGRFWLSRELLSAWLQELDTPLALRNAAMLQAGYALIYSAAPLGDPSLARADEAMAQLVQVHDPMPALLIDAQWNVLRLNQGSRWLAPTLMPGAAGLLQSAPLNMLDLLAHPEAARRDRRLMAVSHRPPDRCG
jgi:transcriptional regulator with XRE-family HTH domain